MSWIRSIDPAAAEGRLARLYDAAITRAGRVFNILRVQSLEPRTLAASTALYAATTTSPASPLSRWFRELIAVSVSRLNGCHY